MAMEGNKSAHTEVSAEVLQDESPSRESSPPPASVLDNEEKATYLRFLLSNAEAGSIIGKGGSTINDIQSQSGARIQLSRNFEYFPGTSDRIIMVSGRVDDILKAVDLILSKLLDEDGDETVPESKIRLVVPNSSCGRIIGKGGSIIRTLIEDSRTIIKISPQDNYYPGVHDRLVTVTGALGEQMRAVELILLKLVEDQYYHQSATVPFPYAVTYNGMNYGPNVARGKYHHNRSPNKVQEDRSSSITIGIADEHIGIVVGRGGRNIMELSQLSGARIKISERGDFMSGTSDRKSPSRGLKEQLAWLSP
ncbi:hypothetical protein OROMI_001312 [Orobanche minor]